MFRCVLGTTLTDGSSGSRFHLTVYNIRPALATLQLCSPVKYKMKHND